MQVNNVNLYKFPIRRLDLLKFKQDLCSSEKVIQVFRNHAFEQVASIISPFLNEAQISTKFIYSDYDDSLNFHIVTADLYLLWLDLSRYNEDVVNDFLYEKLLELKSLTDKPILCLTIGRKTNIDISNLSDVFLENLDPLISSLPDYGLALELENYSGTRLSSLATIKISQKLGLQFIPAIFNFNLKAIVVDLDNTLYSGVLGEDGVQGVILTEDHKKFQLYLKELAEKGYFLCVASKNEEADAKELFEKREDFPLKWSDFTAVAINWNNKAENIYDLAKLMNIGLDSMVFVDDNPAEIQSVEMSGLPIKTILAVDCKSTLEMISLLPGLFKFFVTKEDKIRSKDVKSNIIRSEFKNKLSPREYFEKLQMSLLYKINMEEDLKRATQLFNKTNQFIFNYKRYDESAVEHLIKDDSSILITVSMKDYLSDSGIICLLAAHKNNQHLIVDEITMSCRALGRNLELITIPYMLQLAAKTLETDKTVRVFYRKGARNAPAITWLESYAKFKLVDESGYIDINIDHFIDFSGLKIQVLQ